MSQPAIQLDGVTLAFGAVKALDNLTCELPEATVVGVAGPDGAGKTTLLRVAVGLLSPGEGTVRVLGEELPQGLRRLRSQVGYLPQRLGLLGHLTVAENLDYFAALNGVSAADLREQKARLLDVTGLERFQRRAAEHLSGGMREKLALACAVLHRPRLLLLDEPSTGVDPMSRRDMWELIYALLDEGKSIIVSTPSWEEAARCQWLIVLERGRVLVEGEPTALADGAAGRVFELAAPAAGEAALAGVSWVVAAGRRGQMLRVLVDEDHAGDAGVKALEAELPATGPHGVEPSLEDAMILLTRGRPGAKPSAEAPGAESGEGRRTE